MPPKWAMGLWYHPQEHSNQNVVLDVVASFAKNDVPLAALTLEPPWQVRDPTAWTTLQHDGLITSDCGATRSLSIKWP